MDAVGKGGDREFNLISFKKTPPQLDHSVCCQGRVRYSLLVGL